MEWQAQRRDVHKLGRSEAFLKQLIFGGNDGIVTTFAVVAGFAGAQAEGVAQVGGLAVLVFGLANLFADAVSMGLGEFLSLRSQHDVYRARRMSEMREIQQNPEQERLELAGIFRGRGLPQGDADAAASIVARHPDLMAEMMMTYQFGLHSPDGETPALNGLFTFLSFTAFGTIPLLPYFLLDPTETTFLYSVASTAAALVGLGLLRWNTTGERLARSVGETVAVGATCAAVAYVVGLLVVL